MSASRSRRTLPFFFLPVLGLLAPGCPRPGLAPDDPADTTTDTSTDTTTTVTTSDSTTTTTTTSSTTQDGTSTGSTTDSEPVLLKTISAPSIDAGQSVLVSAKGRVVWAGSLGPKTGEIDGFVQALEPDGSEAWSYGALAGPGAQQVLRVVESGDTLFAAGATAAAGASSNGFVLGLNGEGLSEKLSQITSPGNDTVTALAPAFDGKGGVFGAGTIGGTAAIPGGAGAMFGDAHDLFVMRLLPDGFAPWNMVCAGDTSDPVARALAVDPAHSRLYLGLNVTGPLAVPQAVPDSLSPLTGDPSDAAVYVIDPSLPASAPVTSRVLLRSSGADTLEALVPDPDGTLYVAGTYRGPELKIAGKAVLNGEADMLAEGYVARIDTSGAVLWSNRFGGTGNQQIRAMALAKDALYVTGVFDSDGAFGSAKATHAQGMDFFLARLDAGTGKVLWLHASAGSGSEWVNAIAVDSQGGVWLAGDFSGDLSFEGAAATAKGDFDAMLLRVPPSKLF